jgi:hypothetical protein
MSAMLPGPRGVKSIPHSVCSLRSSAINQPVESAQLFYSMFCWDADLKLAFMGQINLSDSLGKPVFVYLPIVTVARFTLCYRRLY